MGGTSHEEKVRTFHGLLEPKVMAGVLDTLGHESVLNHNWKVLQYHTSGQIWQSALEQGALTSNATAHIDKNGGLGGGAYACQQSLKVDHVQPGLLPAHSCHPETEFGSQVGSIGMGPLEGWTICIVSDLEWRLCHTLWVLVFGCLEEFRGFENPRGVNVEPDAILSIWSTSLYT